MATIERAHTAQIVAHATEYSSEKDGQGTGSGEGQDSNDAERHQTEEGLSSDNPAVLINAEIESDHTLDGVVAYRAAALQVLEPGIDHGPPRPLRGPDNYLPATAIRHVYEDHASDLPHHAINIAT